MNKAKGEVVIFSYWIFVHKYEIGWCAYKCDVGTAYIDDFNGHFSYVSCIIKYFHKNWKRRYSILGIGTNCFPYSRDQLLAEQRRKCGSLPAVNNSKSYRTGSGDNLRLIHAHHAVPMQFPWRSTAALIHTCHAAPLPFSDSAVSFVEVRGGGENIRTASLLLVTNFVEEAESGQVAHMPCLDGWC
jgi:hypothetical protein